MTSALDKVMLGLQKLKQIGESPATFDQREKTVNQLKIDLTFFQNLPPAFQLDPKECILASKLLILQPISS